jgi:hypothetical protein
MLLTTFFGFVTVRASFVLSRRIIAVVRLFRRNIQRISCDKFPKTYFPDDALYKSLCRFVFCISIILALDLTKAPSDLVLIRDFEFVMIQRDSINFCQNIGSFLAGVRKQELEADGIP